MNRIITFALVFSCVFLLSNCAKDSARDQEFSDELKKFEAIRANTSIGKAERDKQMDELAKKLTRIYPGAPPIGKDSTEKIIKPDLPDTLGIFHRTERDTFYQKPNDALPFDSVTLHSKKEYFVGVANYGVRKGKRFLPNQGMLVFVKDEGYQPEWFGALMLDQVLKGNGKGGFDALMRSHKFVKIIEQYGQKWAVWYDEPRPRHQASRVFVTRWNNRFSVFAGTTDTTQHQPDFLDKVIDIAWLDQLKYPVRR